MQYLNNIKVYSKYFHSSILWYNKNKNSISLKIVACPALNQKTFSKHNSNQNENKLLLRLVATQEIIERIRNQEKEYGLEITKSESSKGKLLAESILEEKKSFARSLYEITKEDLGKIIYDLNKKYPVYLTSN